MGDMLDELRIYGFQAGIETLMEKNRVFEPDNGYSWLTTEPDQGEG